MQLGRNKYTVRSRFDPAKSIGKFKINVQYFDKSPTGTWSADNQSGGLT